MQDRVRQPRSKHSPTVLPAPPAPWATRTVPESGRPWRASRSEPATPASSSDSRSTRARRSSASSSLAPTGCGSSARASASARAPSRSTAWPASDSVTRPAWCGWRRSAAELEEATRARLRRRAQGRVARLLDHAARPRHRRHARVRRRQPLRRARRLRRAALARPAVQAAAPRLAVDVLGLVPARPSASCAAMLAHRLPPGRPWPLAVPGRVGAGEAEHRERVRRSAPRTSSSPATRATTCCSPATSPPVAPTRARGSTRPSRTCRRRLASCCFAPTWRDGGADPTVPTAAEWDAIVAWLEEHDAVLLVRTHPLGRGDYADGPARSDRIRLLGPDRPARRQPGAAGPSTPLVTDYSSIVFDFALVGRSRSSSYAPDLDRLRLDARLLRAVRRVHRRPGTSPPGTDALERLGAALGEDADGPAHRHARAPAPGVLRRPRRPRRPTGCSTRSLGARTGLGRDSSVPTARGRRGRSGRRRRSRIDRRHCAALTIARLRPRARAGRASGSGRGETTGVVPAARLPLGIRAGWPCRPTPTGSRSPDGVHRGSRSIARAARDPPRALPRHRAASTAAVSSSRSARRSPTTSAARRPSARSSAPTVGRPPDAGGRRLLRELPRTSAACNPRGDRPRPRRDAAVDASLLERRRRVGARCRTGRCGSSRAAASGGASAARPASSSSTTGCASVSARRRHQHVLQTWHGSTLKRLARDRPDVGLRTRIAAPREGRRWDALLAQNEFSAEHLASAYAFGGPVWVEGYPRNDVLARPERIADVRRRLGRRRRHAHRALRPHLARRPHRDGRLPRRRRVRPSPGTRPRAARPRPQQHLGHGRDHAAPGLIDVTSYPDISDLLLIADVLVTDYSSVMFDFACRPGGRSSSSCPTSPHYSDELRGFYVDLLSEAPGPVVETATTCGDAILHAEQHRDEHADGLRLAEAVHGARRRATRASASCSG